MNDQRDSPGIIHEHPGDLFRHRNLADSDYRHHKAQQNAENQNDQRCPQGKGNHGEDKPHIFQNDCSAQHYPTRFSV